MIKIVLAFAALIIVVSAVFAFQKLTTPTAEINNHTFSLILAKTESDRQTGLSKYKSLDQDKAMLFIFDKPDYYRFWMKDMKFPIDIIFIKNGKISQIVEGAQTPKASNLTIYPSSEMIDKVLEINSGLSQKYNFKPGVDVKLSNIR